MKKFILSFIVVGVIGCMLLYYFQPFKSIKSKELSYICKAADENLYINKSNSWDKLFIKGVNLGVGKPGSFPGELAITKEEYLRWFKYISDMNANTIRVYTIQNTDFYEALYEYNAKAKNQLYIIQGIWVNEEGLSKYSDISNTNIKDTFIKDSQDCIDVIHGNVKLPEKAGFASGKYKKDVSKYVIAWVLGNEWPPEVINGTNNNNKDKTNYEGKYLYTNNATPFETCLAEVGDKLIEYEVDKYNMQRPISFANWATADMLTHPNEPDPTEDEAVFNMENIKFNNNFQAGVFASYNIYPYYPEFINTEDKYVNDKKEDGTVDPYNAYLKDIKKQHTIPVLITEFGVPASRGIAHKNKVTNYSQGNESETQQGEMDADMLKDIKNAGYAGGLIFTWQDEWFKKTWNTMYQDIADRRAYWSNEETNEQQFGLLAFDPGKTKNAAYVDGDISEWKKENKLVGGENLNLSIKSDEKYVYFMADIKDYKEGDKLAIPIDIINNQGNTKFNKLGVSFDRDADFVIVIDGKDNSTMLVDSYYDAFTYIYSNNKYIHNKKVLDSISSSFNVKNSGEFVPINLLLSYPLYFPQTEVLLPSEKYDTGHLTFGDGNPENQGYDSLTDFNIKDGKVEIRIPWMLLNVMDPSSKMIMSDFHESGISAVETDGFYAGISLIRNNDIVENDTMKEYSWDKWDKPTYHERLKKSYYILQKELKNIN